MKQYVINISDDNKAGQLMSLLKDLSYVKVLEPKEKPTSKRYPLMDNPLPVQDFKRFNRGELYDR